MIQDYLDQNDSRIIAQGGIIGFLDAPRSKRSWILHPALDCPKGMHPVK